jgi:magnesium-transporting ATPase (P-type)
VPLAQLRADLERRFADLSGDGYRVLALASRPLDRTSLAGTADEAQMTLRGLLPFLDPPKPGAAEAIHRLAGLDVSVRLVTGDHRLAARKVAAAVGLDADRLLVGGDIDRLDDAALAGQAGDTQVFAEVEPLHKERIVHALRQRHPVVGFLGDGINDAAALHAAGFLPFLPLLPRQILLLNFLSDIPGVTIAGDSVDPEQLQRPRAWNLRSIRTFMVVFGLLSSVFDIITFAILRLGFGAGATLFRSAWFIESTVTELAVMLVLRTNRPFYRSRPGRALLGSSAAIAAITVALPYSPLAGPLGLSAVPAAILATLAGLTALYVIANEAAKRRYPPSDAAATPGARG